MQQYWFNGLILEAWKAINHIDEIPITGIGKLSDFSSININTVQEYTRSSSIVSDSGGPFYQRENNHLIAQLPPYGETSNDADVHGVRMLFTDNTGTDNGAKPDLSVTSYVKRGKYIDLAVFETKPIESNENEVGRSKNRRTEFYILEK